MLETHLNAVFWIPSGLSLFGAWPMSRASLSAKIAAVVCVGTLSLLPSGDAQLNAQDASAAPKPSPESETPPKPSPESETPPKPAEPPSSKAPAPAASETPPPADKSPIEIDEFIFQEASFPSCHASTIVETRDKTLIAAWFGGTKEKHADVGIWVSRRLGGRWSPPEEVADGVQFLRPDGGKQRYPCWNPVLVQPSDGALMLFYKCGPSPSEWWGMLLRSGNNGETWSFPCRLPEGILGPVKNKPIEIDHGKLICGSSTEHDGWRVHFEITPDHGRTWTKTAPVNDGTKIAAIQPSILVHPMHKLQALGRSQQGNLWTTFSTDGGLTWSPMTLLDVPNPNSGTDALTLADGRHILVYNHSTDKRTPLNVAISSDGLKWRMVHTLEDEPGEYSYPAVIQTADGMLHITYTWKRTRIKHVVLDPERL